MWKNLERTELKLNKFLTFIMGEGKLTKQQVLLLIRRAERILEKEGNVLSLKGDFNVVGDIHGQVYDLMKFFKLSGKIDEERYVFLGDYVDRGQFGVEVLLVLIAVKINYPN